jgi:YD repeat-containing protein
MKTSKLYASILAGLFLQCAAASAADLFLVTIRGTCKFNNGDRIATGKFNNASLIQDFVGVNQPTNDTRTLRLAYDSAGDRIVVADNTGQTLGEVFGFGFPVSVADSADSQHVRHVFLFAPGTTDAIGSAIVTDKVVRDGEQNVTRLSARGTMQFGQAGTDTVAAQVCSGTFTVGKKMNPTSTSTNTPNPNPTP